MKRILVIIAILLFTSACSSNYLKSINLNKLTEKIKNEETFILYLTNEDEYGVTLRNTLLDVAKENNIKVFYLNTNKLTDEELKTLKENFYFEETNFITFVKKGKENTVLSRISDTYISNDKLEEELKIQEFIK